MHEQKKKKKLTKKTNLSSIGKATKVGARSQFTFFFFFTEDSNEHYHLVLLPLLLPATVMVLLAFSSLTIIILTSACFSFRFPLAGGREGQKCLQRHKIIHNRLLARLSISMHLFTPMSCRVKVRYFSVSFRESNQYKSYSDE